MKRFKEILHEANARKARKNVSVENLMKKVKSGAYTSLNSDEKTELLGHLKTITNPLKFGYRTVGNAYANANQILKTNNIKHKAAGSIEQAATAHDREMTDKRMAQEDR